mmetsp:Transcript_13873/g.22983  ORF Transcript_13873/g.22983 Transcript_13873/m.22983 type:complete len:246 (+) Transcript_13873:63-800(+)
MSISEAMIIRASGEYDCEVVGNLKLEGLRLRNITCLEACISLVDLSLSRNEIMSITGLETLVNLKRLDLSFNRIRKLDGLSECAALEWLDLRANSITQIDEVSALSKNKHLASLFFRNTDGGEANHVCEHPAYKTIVLRTIPDLNILDGGLVGLIDASDQLQKHLENLKPKVDEADLNPTLENWFEEEMNGNGATEDNIDDGYLQEKFPDVKESAERVNDMLREESAYILRQATSAINKSKKPIE